MLCRTLRLGADDPEMEVDRLAGRRDAEFGCQCAPAVLEGAQRRRAIARGCKGGDQLAVRLFTERVVLDRPTSEVDGLVEATEGTGRGRGHLQSAVARPFDACAMAREPLGVEIRQQRFGETFERLGGQPDRRIRIAGGERLVGGVGQADGSVHVDRAVGREAVAARRRLDDDLAAGPDRVEALAQFGDDVAQRRLPVGRRRLPPHHVRQAIHRHRAGGQPQGGHAAAGESGVDRHPAALVDDGDVAE